MTDNVTTLKELPNSKVYFKEVDVLKGIAIFLVVLGHAIIYFPVNLHENTYCQLLFEFISSVHIPLFFIVSGFLFSFKGTYKDYIKKKVLRLVVPYFVFNFIDIFPRCFFSTFVNRPSSLKESIIKILLHGGEYWFLYTLFLIFLIFPFVIKIFGNRPRRLCFLLLTFVIACNSISIFLFYFTAGYVIKCEKIYIKENVINNIYKFGFLAFLPWVALFVLNLKFDFSFIQVLTAICGIFFFFSITQNKVILKIFTIAGKYSLQLYLFNGYLLVVSRVLVCNYLNVTSPIIIISVNMLVTYVLSLMFTHFIISRFKITRFLTGM